MDLVLHVEIDDGGADWPSVTVYYHPAASRSHLSALPGPGR